MGVRGQLSKASGGGRVVTINGTPKRSPAFATSCVNLVRSLNPSPKLWFFPLKTRDNDSAYIIAKLCCATVRLK